MPPTCTRCGNSVHSPGAAVCAVCGAPLPAMPAAPPVFGGGAAALPMLVAPGGRRYRLSPTTETLIGSRGCAILLTNPGVAAQHARISPSGAGFHVESLGGAVRVNGRVISGAVPLQTGDTLAVGSTQLVYQGGAAPAPAVGPALAVAPPAAPAPGVPGPAPARPVATGALASGQVTVADPERMDSPPADAARAMVIVSVVLAVLALLLIAIVSSLVLWLILAIFGLGGVACLLPMVFPMLMQLFKPIFDALRGRQQVPILNFQVVDAANGMPADVMLIRKRGSGGNVRLGDQVRVWGRAQGSGLIRAYTVEIYESGGRPANVRLEGQRPWPLWVGWLSLGGLALAVGYAVLSLTSR